MVRRSGGQTAVRLRLDLAERRRGTLAKQRKYELTPILPTQDLPIGCFPGRAMELARVSQSLFENQSFRRIFSSESRCHREFPFLGLIDVSPFLLTCSIKHQESLLHPGAFRSVRIAVFPYNRVH